MAPTEYCIGSSVTSPVVRDRAPSDALVTAAPTVNGVSEMMFAGAPGITVNTTVERNTFAWLNATTGSYELEFTGADGNVSETPYVVFHHNYVKPVERVVPSFAGTFRSRVEFG
jgi:hypothetical protein